MSILGNVKTGVRPRPRRCFIYGRQGLGKSTFAAQATKAIFIDTEDGLGDVDCARLPCARSLDDVLGALDALIRDPHDYATVVIDTVDWLEKLIFARVCEAEGVSSIERIGYGKGYKFAIKWWEQIFRRLDILRETRGMMIVLVGHAKIERFNDPAGDPYDRYSPDLHKEISSTVCEWVDEILFATLKIVTIKEESGFGAKRARGVGGEERAIYTQERASHIAKNRIPGLPEELPLDFRAYAHYAFGRTTAPAAEPAPQPAGESLPQSNPVAEHPAT